MKEIAKIAWRSPSNIAFIKYWGKYGIQYPKNPSLSMTLDKCATETSITLMPKENDRERDFTFLFHGKENKAFSKRIDTYLKSLRPFLSFFGDYKLLISSENSFPHSTGIASSASAMSAMALCLSSLEQRYAGNSEKDFYRQASQMARLGSGSAARSLYKGYSLWGETALVSNSSNDYAIEFSEDVHEDFLCMKDAVLIINKEQKAVSSSVGHSLMEGHPYSEQRFKQANDNLASLLKVFKSGDFEEFAFILENEALSLHAMMMTAKPWYTLLSPNTITAIQRIRDFRNETNTKIAFTLDAGPNIHIIYPGSEELKVSEFINSELLILCQGQKIIKDNIGLGPELLVEEYN